MKRRPPRESSPDPDDIHRQMLEHLETNPPPRRRSAGSKPAAQRQRRSTRSRPAPPKPVRRPRLMLRKLRLEQALLSLARFVEDHCHRGTEEIVVVVGKGRASGQEGPVIGPAVRRWCDEHPQRVTDWRVAPPSEGGDGALVLRLVSLRTGS